MVEMSWQQVFSQVREHTKMKGWSHMKGLQNKVAVVTGSSSGIGKAAAELLAQEGTKVVIADVDVQCGEAVAEQIRQSGGDAMFVRTDVSNEVDVQALISKTVRTYGRLDFGINNAGVGGVSAPTADYSEVEWRRVIDINLTGVWLCMKYEIPALLAAGGGAIVNVASILGQVGFANAPAYVAAKHGVIGLTKTAAIEYASQGVRVTAVCPAFIATPMLEHAGIKEGSDLYNMVAGMHPMKRLGTPEEVADLITWLCSDGASFVTGNPILVDGGYVAQ
jgi:NAD(P)-dependent dehydrogenase (short-subunit alcohol dehydrogenase family)